MLLNAWIWLTEQLTLILQILLAFDMELHRILPPILHLQPKAFLWASITFFVFHMKIINFEASTSYGTLFYLKELHNKLLQAVDATQLHFLDTEKVRQHVSQMMLFLLEEWHFHTIKNIWRWQVCCITSCYNRVKQSRQTATNLSDALEEDMYWPRTS